MSDGITEARRGTYFSDRSSNLSEKERIERRIRVVKSEIDDYKWELQDLEERLKNLESNEITRQE